MTEPSESSRSANISANFAPADATPDNMLNYASPLMLATPDSPPKSPRAILLIGVLSIFSIPLMVSMPSRIFELTVVALAIGLALTNVFTALAYFLKYRAPGDRRRLWEIFAGLFLSSLTIVIVIQIVIELAEFRNALLKD